MMNEVMAKAIKTKGMFQWTGLPEDLIMTCLVGYK